MIAIRNADTGEVQVVASLSGYGDGWSVVADPAPEQPFIWDGAELVPDLAALKAARRSVINAARDLAQDGGADTPSGRMQSDPRSRALLNGAVTSAVLATMADAPFAIAWTLADNGAKTLDAPAMIAAGQAVAAHIGAIHTRASVLKGRIDAAISAAEIATVVWSMEDEDDT